MQIYAYVALNFMLNLRNYANYAVCSHSAIMPESNAGIIGLAQGGGHQSNQQGSTRSSSVFVKAKCILYSGFISIAYNTRNRRRRAAAHAGGRAWSHTRTVPLLYIGGGGEGLARAGPCNGPVGQFWLAREGKAAFPVACWHHPAFASGQRGQAHAQLCWMECL